MTAIAAASEWVSAPCVVDSRNTRSRESRSPPSSISSRRPASADTAKPLPSALPNVERSGVTPYTPCAPASDQRNPVIISSKTSTTPWRVHSSRRPSR